MQLLTWDTEAVGGRGWGQVSLFACVGRCFCVLACTGRSEVSACGGVRMKELF